MTDSRTPASANSKVMRTFCIIFAFIGLSLASDEFIIGGKGAEQGRWPWQGSLRKLISGGGISLYSHSCGISLISKRWGVTAAHCITQTSRTSLNLMFGSIDREDPAAVYVNATRVIKHERYGSGSGMFPNDIAVIEFNQDVTGTNITPIPMAPAGTDHAGNSDCWITGWGKTEPSGETPKMLQEAHIDVYTQDHCKGIWGAMIYDGHVCIGDTVNHRTSCQGDSGGPLVCKVDGRYELVGATSWGASGCGTEAPAAYSRISYFRDWIQGKTGL